MPAGIVVLAGLGLAALMAVWPAVTFTAAALGVLVWRAPALGFFGALLAIGLEGTVKILILETGSPFPFSSEAVGAGLLDAGLLVAALATLAYDRGAAVRRVWNGAAGWPERGALLALAGWLVVSVFQIVQSGNIVRGLEGFRLTQFYVLAALVALVLFELRAERWRVDALLVVAALLSAYAALRVAVGPAASERSFALAKNTVAEYGRTFKAVGSFSSSNGLESFLAPAAVFALVIGVLRPGLRVLALGTAACALVAAVGTYARGSLVAIAGGMVVATALAFAVGGVSRRARAATVVATIGVLAVVGIAPRIAANASSTPAPAPPSGVPTPTLRERARGIVNPVSDVSVNDRLTTWRHLGREILHQPLGTGLGTVGHASPGAAGAQVTADNSYLKILREQGIPVGALFLVGVFGLCAVVARRLRRVDGESRILGLAALCGFLSFLFLSVAGEAVEQPGKAFAWTLLGVAVAQAWSGRRESRLSEVAVAREKAPNT